MLLNLDIRKSPGPDDIPNSFFKKYAERCAKYLYVVFTRSLNEGTLPDDWRLAKIKPVHKAWEKTSTSCKVLEHIKYKYY